mmetsp:Transcript_2988/g.401  ORF Transcript_2988/g.401 Transcript_2988/m.401 type:complete len:108 (+) Transcript_2988:126-449(+)
MILGLVCIYIFSVFGYRYFADFYDHTMDIDFVTYCESLFDCFLSTFNNGIRYGGGIGEALHPPLKESGLYWQRMVFDILFFVVIVLMLLNIIFGIIIDTFAELRIKR